MKRNIHKKLQVAWKNRSSTLIITKGNYMGTFQSRMTTTYVRLVENVHTIVQLRTVTERFELKAYPIATPRFPLPRRGPSGRRLDGVSVGGSGPQRKASRPTRLDAAAVQRPSRMCTVKQCREHWCRERLLIMKKSS